MFFLARDFYFQNGLALRLLRVGRTTAPQLRRILSWGIHFWQCRKCLGTLSIDSIALMLQGSAGRSFLSKDPFENTSPMTKIKLELFISVVCFPAGKVYDRMNTGECLQGDRYNFLFLRILRLKPPEHSKNCILLEKTAKNLIFYKILDFFTNY